MSPHETAAALVPLSWGVQCPSCETVIDVEVDEDDSGAFVPSGADCWVLCECNALISVGAVSVSPISTTRAAEGDTP